MVADQLKEIRRERFDKMEQRLSERRKPEERMFYLHDSEDRIVLSHALFWVMTQSYKGRLSKAKPFLLLRQYEEEMLDAYLAEDEYFPELLRYCNILYELLPISLYAGQDFKTNSAVRKLAAIGIVAAGYGGDCPQKVCDELLDDMDFYRNKVKCRKIESLLPLLNEYVTEELRQMP